MLKDEELKKALWCIRCGACLNHCPVYNTIGGHAYGTVIPGPIGQILMPQLYGLDKHGDLSSASTLCGKCSEVCPVKIPISDLILDLRAEFSGNLNRKKISEQKNRANIEMIVWFIWGLIFSIPSIHNTLRRIAPYFPLKLLGLFPPLSLWLKHHSPISISKKVTQKR